MTEDAWDALPWDRQRNLFEGMVAEGLIQADDGAMPQEDGQPVFSSRKADTGVGVIDLQEMIRQSRGT